MIWSVHAVVLLQALHTHVRELLLGGVDDRQQKTLLFHRIGLELGGQPPSFTPFFYVTAKGNLQKDNMQPF